MIIVADRNIPYVQEYFSPYGDLILKPGREITPQDVMHADLLLVRSTTRVDRALLGHSQVKFVGSITAGMDHLDVKWLDAQSIYWCAAKGFNASSVADYVMSVLAALQHEKILSTEKLKAGVIGVGNVGNLVAERLKLLNYDVILCDPIRAGREKTLSFIPLQEFENLDLISLHVPLTVEGEHPTFHFINKSFLKKQKPGCVLVNTSRGAVIDSEALIRYGSHLQWVLDVWENEPNIAKDLMMKAVIATPHIAGYSKQSKIRGIEMIYHMACQQKFITAQVNPPIRMMSQTLTFSGGPHTWQDIVLGVFNPLSVSAMMRSLLLPAEHHGHLFDEMRHSFNYRYELAYTRLKGVNVNERDRKFLEKLGLTFV